MPLDLSSLNKAVGSFERMLNAATSQEKMSKLDDDQKDAIRAGVIQSFEYTYEICWKIMKRWLENNLGKIQVEGVTRRELFRLAIEHQLIEDVDLWMDFHDARNETVHTYNALKAQDIFNVAIEFFGYAQKFAKKLEKKND